MTVPKVDINAPLPVFEEPKVDEVMVVARREWYIGIGVFVVFVAVIGGVAWGYNNMDRKNISSSDTADNVIVVSPSPLASIIPQIKPVFTVWNGSGVAGAAGVVAEKLKSEGYEVIETKNAPKAQTGTTLEMAEELVSMKDKIMELTGAKNYSNLEDTSLGYTARVIIGK